MGFLANVYNGLGDLALWSYEEMSIYRRKRAAPAADTGSGALARLAAADCREVERVTNIGQAEFLQRHLLAREPVIVSDGLRDWPARDIWRFEYFCREFGRMPVRLQDAGFKPKDEVELEAYLRRIATLPPVALGQTDGSHDYLRYTYDSFLKHLLFTWGFGRWVRTRSFSFVAFQRLAAHWHRPYFLPARGYRIPWVQFGELHPNERMCQDWGLYFSAPGACTRLHIDGMRTNAVLCQLEGRKGGWIFSASLEDAVRAAAEGRATPAAGAAPILPAAQGRDRIWRFELAPGEVMLIPRGLAHEVHTLSPSISLTYNFLTNPEYRDYYAHKRERGHGWVARAPIAAVPEFARRHCPVPMAVRPDENSHAA